MNFFYQPRYLPGLFCWYIPAVLMLLYLLPASYLWRMLRVGVFGTGHLGKFHLNNWKELEDVQLVGFFDPDDAIAKEVEEKYLLPRFTNEDELIAACDALDIVTPTQYHFELCEKAIKKGKHVFVEKPMANTIDEAKELVKLVKESKVKFQVGHVERFNPAFLAVQKLKINPMFIEVHRLAQFNPRGTEVSVILDLMIHDIDAILSLVKSDVKTISASGVAVMTDTPDIANVRIEFNNGCVANLTSSRISMKKMRKMRMFQKDAYIAIDFLEKKTEIIKLKTEEDVNVFSFDIETPGGVKTIAIANPEVPQVNAIKKELEEFVAAIRNNTQPIVNEIDGYRALEVAHQILQKINYNLTAS
ncbi:MAG: Gfo/Idh/MocA family oxidoreductase [Flavisolibacter sp.]|jgi:predicted dehydrogenase|nr:Gfo/Idh/MocA family oxidoreductase [Flavisolibacter sp.]